MTNITDTNLIEWQKFRNNASIKSLAENNSVKFSIIKLEPDSQFDEHIHDNTEWVFVLNGSYSDENGSYSKGCFVINKKGSKHSTKSSSEGCELLLIKLSE